MIERTVAEVLQLGHNYVGTEHILLALFADAEALAARVFAEEGHGRRRSLSRRRPWPNGPW